MDRDDIRTADVCTYSTIVVVGIVLFVLVLASPVFGLTLTESPDQFQDGTATITVEKPDGDQLSVTKGRFGTPAMYLRIPDLEATVKEVSGQPRIIYELSVPELGVEIRETRVVSTTGTVRVPVSDRAFEEIRSGTYDGRLVVRVQSTDGDWTVLDRGMEVQVP